MSDPLLSLDLFIRGLACGALAAIVLGALRSPISRRVRIALAFWGPSTLAWMMTESSHLWALLGHAYPLIFLAYPVAGLFWMFIAVLFDDAPLDPLRWTPAAILWISGVACSFVSEPHWSTGFWAVRNLFSLALNLHAGFIIVRGARNDLLEDRRRLRGPLLAVAAGFVVFQVLVSLVQRFNPSGDWHLWFTGEIYGGAVFAGLMLAGAGLFLQARPEFFGVPVRPAAPTEADVSRYAEVRADAAEQALLDRLRALMASEAWRRDGLTIGELAGDLGVPEHQLRRLINRRLGYRNFTDFINSYRIEAAKRRLADPAEARVTVAAIAFDMGYGSLGPFNRAFRLACGMSPTAWREAALKSSPKMDEPV